MKYIIVYHDTETLANRAYHPHTGETVSYRGIDEWDDDVNKDFDEVINLSTNEKET